MRAIFPERSRLLIPYVVFVCALIADSIRRCQIDATFFGSGDNACPCYYSILRPASACPRLDCTAGYRSSCYSQCQRRKRREAAPSLLEGTTGTDNPASPSYHHLAKINQCNNVRLQQLIESTMQANTDLEVAKMKILEVGESVLRTQLNVICADQEPLSYVTITANYCLVAKGNRSCYAFTAPSRTIRAVIANEETH